VPEEKTMLVADHMSQPPISASPSMSVAEALKTMRTKRIRRLPVVDGAGHLVGIVSDKDLLHASPSPATSLSVWEIADLLARLTVGDVMTRLVLVVRPDTSLEEAAQVMVESKIGGLPVVSGGRLLGVITETDIFKVFTLLLGASAPGVRATMQLRDEPGQVAVVTAAVTDAGGEVTAIAEYPAGGTSSRAVFMKVTGLTPGALDATLRPLVVALADVREHEPMRPALETAPA
jgi:acetoin utilization protein AcuB